MTTDPDNPEILLSVPTELEAIAVVSALMECGVEASTTGGLTSGFRAEAPGEVNVIVRRQDLDRAHELIRQFEQNKSAIDWSKVDVGEPEDA